MSEDIDYNKIQEEIIRKLKTCYDTLMVCAVEGRKCRKCKDKDSCLIYIRTVLASLCKIEVIKMESIDVSETPMGMYS